MIETGLLAAGRSADMCSIRDKIQLLTETWAIVASEKKVYRNDTARRLYVGSTTTGLGSASSRQMDIHSNTQSVTLILLRFLNIAH